jgi:hypothetical protein
MTVDLVVHTGKPLVVSGPLGRLYDSFIMEDNSTIIAEVDITISAITATIGNNCIIDGSGGNGPNGQNETYVPPQSGQNNAGYDGLNGGGGGNGVKGKNITLNVGLRPGSIGSLLIRSNGGNGGNGENGGKGGSATCVGGDGAFGGHGGDGGQAGFGGDAGQITFNWSSIAASAQDELAKLPKDLPNLTTLPDGKLVLAALPGGLNPPIANGGEPGGPGAPGKGGAGGDGVGCGWWHNGGGPSGKSGRYGMQGHPGSSKIPVITFR